MTGKLKITDIGNDSRFRKFVEENVYWWGDRRSELNVDAVLCFILAKHPRSVEDMAREKFGFTDDDFIRALKGTPRYSARTLLGGRDREKVERDKRQVGDKPTLAVSKKFSGGLGL